MSRKGPQQHCEAAQGKDVIARQSAHSAGAGPLVVGMDVSRGTDCGATAVFRRDEHGNLHLLALFIDEPPKAPIETRRVPGSSPTRYEPL